MIAAIPFDEPGSTPPLFGLEHFACMLLIDDHAVDHVTPHVKGVAADGSSAWQRKIEIAFGRLGFRVGEGHRGGRFGKVADDPHVEVQTDKPGESPLPLFWTTMVGVHS